MGFIKKLFKRDLTPEQQEEKSRKEKEWMERNWQRGYRFAEKIGLRDKIDKIDKWGTKYPKTFFGIIFACLFLSIILNHCAAMKSDSVEENIQNLKSIGDMGYTPPQDTKLGVEIIQMYEELDGIDKQIRQIISKDSLTHEDSVKVRDLLIKGEGINTLLNGERKNIPAINEP